MLPSGGVTTRSAFRVSDDRKALEECAIKRHPDDLLSPIDDKDVVRRAAAARLGKWQGPVHD